jgi:UDP-N-acetylglucosamine transferase subunit ALG13
MIFITVGTANKGFDRLIKMCDMIAKSHQVSFFAQTGSSEYIPQHMPHKKWLSQQEIRERYRLSTAYIVHGGFGTLSEVLSYHKPVIVVPRTFESGEAVNDQRDICIKLASLGYVKCISELFDLEAAVLNLESLKLKKYELVSDIPNILLQQINLLKTK